MFRWLAMSILAALVAVVSLSIILAGRLHPVQSLGLKTVILPGDNMPPGAQCHTYSYYSYEIYCHLASDGGDIYFYPDKKSNKVAGASYLISGHINVGQLLNAWGEPSGERRSEYASEISWPGKYAYVIDRFISPNSPVGYIFFGDSQAEDHKWTGFHNKRTKEFKWTILDLK